MCDFVREFFVSAVRRLSLGPEKHFRIQLVGWNDGDVVTDLALSRNEGLEDLYTR